MIGLSFENKSDINILKEMFKNVDLSSYQFYFTEEELYDRNHMDLTTFGLQDYKRNIEEFLEENYYIIFLVMQVYKKSEEKNRQEINTYLDFQNSNCSLILLISDSSDIEIYFKDNELKNQIINNLKRLNIKYEETTPENYTITKMHVN